MKNLKFVCITLICAFLCNISFAQKSIRIEKKAVKAAEIKRLITSGNYVFVPDYAVPNSYAPMALRPTYDVTVTNNQLHIFLPYFGISYDAPRNNLEGGVKLLASDFTNKIISKKNNWEIKLTPQNFDATGVQDVKDLTFAINADGDASLRVTAINRQPISFTGHIEEVKKI